MTKRGGWLRNLNIGSPRLKMEPVRLVYLYEEYEKEKRFKIPMKTLENNHVI